MLDGLSDRQYDQLVAEIHRVEDEALLHRIEAALRGAIGRERHMTITIEQWRAAEWRTSEDSAQGTGSVYVARIGDTVGIRGDDTRTVVTVPLREWDSFAGGVRAGDFDHVSVR
jgi:hypothetical protein